MIASTLTRIGRLVLAAALAAVPACSTTSRGPGSPTSAPAFDANALVVLDGYDGTDRWWDDVLDAAADADVIFLGETHSDTIAHAAQAAYVEAIAERHPGTALSMEMLERNDQPLVDDYLDDIIDAEQLEKLTHSSNWGGKGQWAYTYQPIIDAAKGGGSPVIAANAPRRYVKLARTDGYERIDDLPAPRRDFVDRPSEVEDDSPYRRRFDEMLGGPDDDAHPGMDEETLDAMFRSQLVWDATMAASIDAGLDAGAPKVIHLCGHFHSDFEGGTVMELRRLRPDARILVISLMPGTADSLTDDDDGRADYVVFTGFEGE